MTSLPLFPQMLHPCMYNLFIETQLSLSIFPDYTLKLSLRLGGVGNLRKVLDISDFYMYQRLLCTYDRPQQQGMEIVSP